MNDIRIFKNMGNISGSGLKVFHHISFYSTHNLDSKHGLHFHFSCKPGPCCTVAQLMALLPAHVPCVCYNQMLNSFVVHKDWNKH